MLNSTRLVAVLALIAVVASCDYKPRNQGRVIYERKCQSCHMENGQGLGELIPPVANADYVLENKTKLACIIRYGISGPIEVNGIQFTGEMKGDQQLTEVEINNLVHYILVDMNQQKEPFQISEIRSQLQDCKSNY